MNLNNLTQAEYYALIEDHGHVLLRDEDGRIDIFGFECDYHNGPRCVRCHDCWCHHCRDSIEMCSDAHSELFPLTADDARKSP